MVDADGAARQGGAPRARIASTESEAAIVQAAVERFVELHSSGETPDLAEFVQAFPEALRPRILAQCNEFLAFDGLLGHQPWEAPPDDEADDAGRRFGDFDITEELGRGGMGVVYLARQRSLNRRVALKVMASGLTLSKRHVERFRREAAATAQLRHPAIVHVHSLEDVDGTFAIAMDYIAGRNLADILDDLRLRNGDEPVAIEGTLGLDPKKGYVAECAMFCAEIGSALSAAHEQGVMHRDLKPRNLMIDDHRQPRLLDFGLSKSLGDGSLSMSGEITGTVHYMSPEQTLAKRVPVDHRADVFALGVILYELLTLKRPFEGKNMQQIVYEICFKEPVSPQRRNPKVPRDLVTICGKALEKDPSKRYQSAAEFEQDLLRFLRWEPIHARPASAISRLGKWVHRHRTEAIAAAVVFVLAAGGLGYAWYSAALDSAEAARLIEQADRQGKAGEFRAALESATQALGKRATPAIEAKIEAYQALFEKAAKQEEVEIADAARLSLASKQVIELDRRLAILLALAAVDRRASSESRSAVLDALGSGFRTTALAGHRDHTALARWSPDGQQVLTAGVDIEEGTKAATAVLWDTDGKVRHTLRGHNHLIVDAAFHPDGSRVATASWDGTVRLWDTATGQLRSIWQHVGAASFVGFSSSGEFALTTSYESKEKRYEAQIWNTATERRVATLKTHTKLVLTAALAANGRFAATWGDPDHVKLWDDSGVELARLTGHRGRVKAIAFAPDSSMVAVAGSDGGVRLFAVPSGEPRGAAAHSREVTALRFDEQGERLLSASRDMTARLWRLETDNDTTRLREEHQFVGHKDVVTSARFDPSGKFVVTGGADGTLRVFDAGRDPSTAGREVMHYEAGAATIGRVAFSPDPVAGRVLAVAGQDAVIWEFADTRGVVTLRQEGKVPAACFDAGGEHVATAGDDETLRLWDARSGSLLWAVPLDNPIEALAIDAAGERIVASTTGGAVHVHRLSDGAPLYRLPGHTKDVGVVRFAAGGTRILTASEDRTARVWNANDQSEVLEVARSQPIVAADITPDGQLLATVEADAAVARLWSVPGGEPRGEIATPAATLREVAFRPDGKAVLTAGEDGWVRITDLSGQALRTIDTGHPVRRAAWSRDARQILTTSADDRFRVRLWNVEDASEELRFGAHTAAVDCNAFSRDGRWAVTTSRDGTARIWPTDPVGIARRLELPPLTAAERTGYRLDRKQD